MTEAKPVEIGQDVYDHLPRLHRVIADLMIERGELVVKESEAV